MTERWLPVVGWVGYYEVSDLGRVRSLDRVIVPRGRSGYLKPGRLRKASLDSRGYPMVTLSLNAKTTSHLVHHLVLTTFVGPKPPGQECLHRDGDPTNARLSNLHWGTKRENRLDAVKHGTDFQASKTHCPQGHPYNASNTYTEVATSKKKYRICKTCTKESSARRYAARNSVV